MTDRMKDDHDLIRKLRGVDFVFSGGRDYQLTSKDYEWIASHTFFIANMYIIGDATGADECMWNFVEDNDLPRQRFYADWKRYGKSAGPMRNKVMLDYAGPDAEVILFPGGKGTANMKAQAEERGFIIHDLSKGYNK